jgi:hypothetical protein
MPIPNPDGYDDLIRASRSIVGPEPKAADFRVTGLDLAAIEEMAGRPPWAGSWDEARAYVEANRDVLSLARVGLGRECVVPVVYRAGYTATTNDSHASLNGLARIFRWEARLAIREGRPADAARTFLDMVRLGHASSRGGLETNFWGPGYQIESGGLLGLALVSHDLDPATCRRAIGILHDLDLRREPYRAFQARDAAYSEAALGRFQTARFELENYRRLAEERSWLTELYDEAIAHLRLVEVELALRAYRAEKGEEPSNLEALVPSYLPELPLDPFSGRPPVYRRSKSGHTLYSLGPDHVDDGGAPLNRPNPRARPTGDIRPDSPASPLMP